MLTKQERDEIAERANKYPDIDDNLYEVLFGCAIPTHTKLEDDANAMKARLIDLYDTSNMVELPVDKDGEVIHIGDIVYAGEREFTVDGFIFNGSNVIVRAIHTKLSALNFCKPGELTHKKPGAIESLVSEIRHVINRGEMTSWSMSKLFDIAEQLEKLGDNDA